LCDSSKHDDACGDVYGASSGGDDDDVSCACEVYAFYAAQPELDDSRRSHQA